MAEKRSAGIIILAVFTILLSIIRLISTGSIFPGFSNIVPAPALTVIVVYSLASNIAYIISSVNILRLKDWARRFLVYLTIIQACYMMIVSMPLAGRSIESMKSSPESLERVRQGYLAIPEELRLERDIEKDTYAEMVFMYMYRMSRMVNTVSLIYLFIVIFYLTRSKVKRQFLPHTVSNGAGI
jgi:hypothetical protein